MANVNAPFGLRVYRRIGGGADQQHKYTIDTAYSTALYTGDLVKMTGTGLNIARAAAGDDAGVVGVFNGCRYTDATGKRVFSPYWPGSSGNTAIEADVINDPSTLFEIQTEDGTNFTEAMIGQCADVVYTKSGDAKSGLSGMELDISALATTGKQCLIRDLVRRSGNDFGANAKVVVQLVEHMYVTNKLGVGV